jgi:septal ring factor EnvC (AmiA/AmiB activator)
MIIEMDDKEIEVDEEDLSSLLDMLNKHRVEQYHSLLSVLSDSQKQSDATPIMIAHFEKALKKVSLPVEIGKVIKPADPLYAVARGCLIAAEASEK